MLATIAAGLAVAVPVALAAGTYNLNGKWAMSAIDCKGRKIPLTGTATVRNWRRRSGHFNWKLGISGHSITGTATESGATITVNRSSVPSLDGHTGTVSKSGSTLKATFPAPCRSGGVGYGIFTKKARRHHHHRHHETRPPSFDLSQ